MREHYDFSKGVKNPYAKRLKEEGHMSRQFESMVEGLNEALKYAKGDKTKGRSRVVEVKNLNVKPLNQSCKEEYEILK